MSLEKIISGAQIGADIAGLRAAKKLGIETGGWIPKGFKTLLGSKPEYKKEFGLMECGSENYKDRTFANVLDSDATVRFAYNFESPGERCTIKAVRKYLRPCFDVHLYSTSRGWEWSVDDGIPEFLAFLGEYEPEVLNIAGNANAAIEPVVEQYLMSALGEVT